MPAQLQMCGKSTMQHKTKGKNLAKIKTNKEINKISLTPSLLDSSLKLGVPKVLQDKTKASQKNEA